MFTYDRSAYRKWRQDVTVLAFVVVDCGAECHDVLVGRGLYLLLAALATAANSLTLGFVHRNKKTRRERKEERKKEGGQREKKRRRR